MKVFLIISQIIYAVMLLPWIVILGLSVMVFDNGISLWGVGLMTAIGLYPLAVIVCSILAWLLLKKLKPAFITIINLVPAIWIVTFLFVIYS